MTTLKSTIPIKKYQGTGNDFVVVDERHSIGDRPSFAVQYCDRQTGVTHESASQVGADGVLFLELDCSPNSPRVLMTLVQPDGSLAPMCGNGARIAAAWGADQAEVSNIVINTPVGARRAVVDDETIRVEMGVPRFSPSAIPLDHDKPLIDTPLGELNVTSVNTGVPHAVAIVSDVDAIDLEAVAPPVRHAECFPRGTNVTLAQQTGPYSFAQRTYERGVEGETRSCGTGAVAVAAVAHRLQRIDSHATVSVSPPGGLLEVTVPKTGQATLAGPVSHEFTTNVERVESTVE
jgi:diaminopimelate epimerase